MPESQLYNKMILQSFSSFGPLTSVLIFIFFSCRKLLSKTDDGVGPRNAVVGSNRKKHNVDSDLGSGSDSDSSIHTSDMSSDEEEEEEEKTGEIQQDDIENDTGDMGEGKGVKTGKLEVDSGCDEKMSEDLTTKVKDSSVKQTVKKTIGYKPVVNIPVNRKADVQVFVAFCAWLIILHFRLY